MGGFRAVQDCKNTYGDFIRIFRTEGVSETRFDEIQVKEIHAKDLKWNTEIAVDHCHTYNRDDEYEVTDFRYVKFFPHKILQRLYTRKKVKKML